ncbi:hypothetical protein SPRG_13515 [Saprolegnia parasitica CBS 223.65]|uniref:Thioredoxin domain-containing protein n=1 Tax=Saprolegnia parasitica (strain CBS 223.65) TaxID=695850 RepID=A0A067BQL0_SAPPC|nr:hypothetical protein SPRG_13515 [Saprolegnia parasitica CBS 223.65]KDO20764.1 hypothetical protein SPRG_13515 [Saprolegnia parasitica CBS 223.65]|eukprot:XP_012208502.1 hypothetical protein SPRG_13515 [Saprolegnia parasitica CBS 223.65]
MAGFWSYLFDDDLDLGPFVDAAGRPATLADLNEIVLVLFSAYWCPPCRAFTPSVLQFLQANPNEVSVIYFGRDHNANMQRFYNRHKPYYRLEWCETNSAAFQAIKAAYPSIQGIPTAFAVERDSGMVFSERARIGVLLQPDTILSLWRAGDDISEADEEAYWLRDEPVADHNEKVDVIAYLPLETLVTAHGDPIDYDALHTFVLLYFSASWASSDELTRSIEEFAAANADDVSVVFFSLDDEPNDNETIKHMSFHRFTYSSHLIEAADAIDKALSAHDAYNTLGAPRLLVIERASHAIVAADHYGLVIKPDDVVSAWKAGDAGVTDDEVDAYFDQR